MLRQRMPQSDGGGHCEAQGLGRDGTIERRARTIWGDSQHYAIRASRTWHFRRWPELQAVTFGRFVRGGHRDQYEWTLERGYLYGTGAAGRGLGRGRSVRI